MFKDKKFMNKIAKKLKKAEAPEFLSKTEVENEIVATVVDPMAAGDITNKLRPISLKLSQDTGTIKGESQVKFNMSIYWGDTWQEIFAASFGESLGDTYSDLKLKLEKIQKLVDIKDYAMAETETKTFLEDVKALEVKFSTNIVTFNTMDAVKEAKQKATLLSKKHIDLIASKYKKQEEAELTAAKERDENRKKVKEIETKKIEDIKDIVKIYTEKNKLVVKLSDIYVNYILKDFEKVDKLDSKISSSNYTVGTKQCNADEFELTYYSPEFGAKDKKGQFVVKRNKQIIGTFKGTFNDYIRVGRLISFTPDQLGFQPDKLQGYVKKQAYTTEVRGILFQIAITKDNMDETIPKIVVALKAAGIRTYGESHVSLVADIYANTKEEAIAIVDHILGESKITAKVELHKSNVMVKKADVWEKISLDDFFYSFIQDNMDAVLDILNKKIEGTTNQYDLKNKVKNLSEYFIKNDYKLDSIDVEEVISLLRDLDIDEADKKSNKIATTIDNITEADFQAYEDVRVSGETNMYMISVVEMLSYLPKDKVITIMKNYSELMKKYPGVRKGRDKQANEDLQVGDPVSVNLATGELLGTIVQIKNDQAFVGYTDEQNMPNSEWFDLDLLIKQANKTAAVTMQNIFFDTVDEAKKWQEMVEQKAKETKENTLEPEHNNDTKKPENIDRNEKNAPETSPEAPMASRDERSPGLNERQDFNNNQLNENVIPNMNELPQAAAKTEDIEKVAKEKKEKKEPTELKAGSKCPKCTLEGKMIVDESKKLNNIWLVCDKCGWSVETEDVNEETAESSLGGNREENKGDEEQTPRDNKKVLKNIKEAEIEKVAAEDLKVDDRVELVDDDLRKEMGIGIVVSRGVGQVTVLWSNGIKDTLNAEQLKEAKIEKVADTLEFTSEHEDLKYELWHNIPNGYYIKGLGEIKNEIAKTYFNEKMDALDHARHEIDGYLMFKGSTAKSDATVKLAESIHSMLEKYDDEDFCDILEARYGWSIAGQARGILNGEDLEEQNTNALRYIQEFASIKGENELANELKAYLDSLEEDGLGLSHTKKTEGKKKVEVHKIAVSYQEGEAKVVQYLRVDDWDYDKNILAIAKNPLLSEEEKNNQITTYLKDNFSSLNDDKMVVDTVYDWDQIVIDNTEVDEFITSENENIETEVFYPAVLELVKQNKTIEDIKKELSSKFDKWFIDKLDDNMEEANRELGKTSSKKTAETNAEEMKRYKHELAKAQKNNDKNRIEYFKLEIRKLQGEIDLRRERKGNKKIAGTWSLPYTEKAALDLKKVLEDIKQKGKTKLTDEDRQTVKDSLYDLIGSDKLFDALEEPANVEWQDMYYITIGFLESILSDYKKKPESFSMNFDVKALDILNGIVKAEGRIANKKVAFDTDEAKEELDDFIMEDLWHGHSIQEIVNHIDDISRSRPLMEEYIENFIGNEFDLRHYIENLKDDIEYDNEDDSENDDADMDLSNKDASEGAKTKEEALLMFSKNSTEAPFTLDEITERTDQGIDYWFNTRSGELIKKIKDKIASNEWEDFKVGDRVENDSTKQTGTVIDGETGVFSVRIDESKDEYDIDEKHAGDWHLIKEDKQASLSIDQVTAKQTEILKMLDFDSQKLIAFLQNNYHDGAVLRQEIESGMEKQLSNDDLAVRVQELVDTGKIFKSIVEQSKSASDIPLTAEAFLADNDKWYLKTVSSASSGIVETYGPFNTLNTLKKFMTMSMTDREMIIDNSGKVVTPTNAKLTIAMKKKAENLVDFAVDSKDNEITIGSYVMINNGDIGKIQSLDLIYDDIAAINFNETYVTGSIQNGMKSSDVIIPTKEQALAAIEKQCKEWYPDSNFDLILKFIEDNINKSEAELVDLAYEQDKKEEEIIVILSDYLKSLNKKSNKLYTLYLLRKSKKDKQIDGMFVNAQDAMNVLNLYDSLNEQNKKKLLGLSIQKMLQVHNYLSKNSAIPFSEMTMKDIEWFPNRMPNDIPYKQDSGKEAKLSEIPILDINASVEDLQNAIDFIGKGKFGSEEADKAFELQAQYQKMYNEKKRLNGN